MSFATSATWSSPSGRSPGIKGSDVPVRQPMGSVNWDFRDGVIGRAPFFPSWEAALEAAGVSE